MTNTNLTDKQAAALAVIKAEGIERFEHGYRTLKGTRVHPHTVGALVRRGLLMYTDNRRNVAIVSVNPHKHLIDGTLNGLRAYNKARRADRAAR